MKQNTLSIYYMPVFCLEITSLNPHTNLPKGISINSHFTGEETNWET